MKIRRSEMKDLDTILEMYKEARKFMAASGNPTQWGNAYPPDEMILKDIQSGNSYVCEENGLIGTVFVFTMTPEKSYEGIYDGQWLNEKPYGVIHRMVSNRKIKGAAQFCLDWAFSQCGNIRIDTHEDNIPMQNLLRKCGFVRCGKINIWNETERIAFQKYSPDKAA